MESFLQNAIANLPQAARSPLAFVAYLGVLLVWGIIAFRVRRHQKLLKKIKDFPEEQRRDLILAEMNTPVPPNLDAEQWLRGRRQSYYLYAFVALCLVFLAVFAIAATQKAAARAIYRLRVTVIDSKEIPVEDAKVWSSVGGEPKRVAGGWQFDIPAASAKDKQLTVYAEKKTAFLSGKHAVELREDFNPAVTIQLEKENSATVRGIVVDDKGRAIAGARVSVIGYGEEAVTTLEDGHFVLPAHAANGQPVRLHAEKAGHESYQDYHPAGDEPAVLILPKLERR